MRSSAPIGQRQQAEPSSRRLARASVGLGPIGCGDQPARRRTRATTADVVGLASPALLGRPPLTVANRHHLRGVHDRRRGSAPRESASGDAARIVDVAPLQFRHDRPTDQGAHRQAGARRPRPRGEGAGAGPPRRGLRGRLHGAPPDARDGRDRGAPGGRRRRRPVDPVGRPHDARATGHEAAPRGGPRRRPRGRRRDHPGRRRRRSSARAGVAAIFGPGTTIAEVADFLRTSARPRA